MATRALGSRRCVNARRPGGTCGRISSSESRRAARDPWRCDTTDHTTDHSSFIQKLPSARLVGASRLALEPASAAALEPAATTKATPSPSPPRLAEQRRRERRLQLTRRRRAANADSRPLGGTQPRSPRSGNRERRRRRFSPRDDLRFGFEREGARRRRARAVLSRRRRRRRAFRQGSAGDARGILASPDPSPKKHCTHSTSFPPGFPNQSCADSFSRNTADDAEASRPSPPAPATRSAPPRRARTPRPPRRRVALEERVLEHSLRASHDGDRAAAAGERLAPRVGVDGDLVPDEARDVRARRGALVAEEHGAASVPVVVRHDVSRKRRGFEGDARAAVRVDRPALLLRDVPRERAPKNARDAAPEEDGAAPPTSAAYASIAPADALPQASFPSNAHFRNVALALAPNTATAPPRPFGGEDERP